MKLTKDQFIEHVDNLRTMVSELDELSGVLRSDELVFGEWFDNYFLLVEEMCEFDELKDYDPYYGYPLDWYVFNMQPKSINITSAKDLWDYLNK